MHLLSVPKRPAIQGLRQNILIALCSALIVGCASTGNNFDESKLSQIKKGETTEAELIQTFGQPENRSVNWKNVTTLTWMYAEATIKGESFIPYAGAFMGGSRSKAKTLMVTLLDSKVTGYTFSGGGGETRGTTQEHAQKLNSTTEGKKLTMILLAILLPPLYFLLNNKIGMALITGAMFIVAVFLAMTIVLIPGSLILWVIAMIAAVRHNRRKEMVAHAEMLTTKMAEKLRPEQTPPVLPR